MQAKRQSGKGSYFGQHGQGRFLQEVTVSAET